jgi:hypothetical protein
MLLIIRYSLLSILFGTYSCRFDLSTSFVCSTKSSAWIFPTIVITILHFYHYSSIYPCHPTLGGHASSFSLPYVPLLFCFRICLCCYGLVAVFRVVIAMMLRRWLSRLFRFECHLRCGSKVLRVRVTPIGAIITCTFNKKNLNCNVKT